MLLLTRPASCIFNVVDDDPAPRSEVIAYAAALLRGETPPPHGKSAELPSAGAGAAEKRVRNNRIKAELFIRLRYPSYREGIRALLPQSSREQ